MHRLEFRLVIESWADKNPSEVRSAWRLFTRTIPFALIKKGSPSFASISQYCFLLLLRSILKRSYNWLTAWKAKVPLSVISIIWHCFPLQAIIPISHPVQLSKSSAFQPRQLHLGIYCLQIMQGITNKQTWHVYAYLLLHLMLVGSDKIHTCCNFQHKW